MAITIAGRFSVEDPWAIPTVAAIPAPRLLNADDMGTMQAEQRVIGAPTMRPFSAPAMPRPENARLVEPGNRKASVRPAIRKAKLIPTATSRK